MYVEEVVDLVGAVRKVHRHTIIVWIENAGEFEVRLEAVQSAHGDKVVLGIERLDKALRHAIAHARDAEVE